MCVGCAPLNLSRRAPLFIAIAESLPIAVGVALELMRQVDSQLMLRNYEGFLK